MRESANKKRKFTKVCTKKKSYRIGHKKEFMHTICAGGENLYFSGNAEFLYTITRARKIIKNAQKCTIKKGLKRRGTPNKKEV